MAEASKIVPDSGKRKPPAAGKGRPKGAVNKATKAVKDMILASLDKVGGEDYLVKQASENPTAYMTLLGKVLPLQLAGGLDLNAKITRLETVVVPAPVSNR